MNDHKRLAHLRHLSQPHPLHSKAAPIWTKTLAKDERPSKRKMGQVYSNTRSRAAKAYQSTCRRLEVVAKKIPLPKRLEKMIIFGNLMARVPFHLITGALVDSKLTRRHVALPQEEIHKDCTLKTPTIILTTPDNQVVPFDQIAPGKKCVLPEGVHDIRREWLDSGLLCSLHAKVNGLGRKNKRHSSSQRAREQQGRKRRRRPCFRHHKRDCQRCEIE